MSKIEEINPQSEPEIVEESIIDEELGEPSEARFRVMFRRFLRHRAGLISAIVLALLLFFIVFAEFFAPYTSGEFHEDSNGLAFDYVPPMISWIHFEGFAPYVYGLQRTYNPLTGIKGYAENQDEKFYLKLIVPGESYLFLGIIPTDIHLFGTGEESGSTGQLFLLGTDRFGRDLLTRILVGGGISLSIGFVVVLISFAIGILLGGISGYYGGPVDTAIQRSVEIAMALPRLALLLALASLLPPDLPAMSRFWGFALLMGLVGWAPLARVVRGQFLALREEGFVQAAHALGFNDFRVIFRHIVPNTLSYLIVSATLTLPSVILLESILSYFGFGLQEPLVSWGLLMGDLQQNFQFQIQFHPWLVLPGFFIFLSVLTINYIGDGIRDAIDPFTISKGDAG
jgi:peptide/nickel transport system permease protein